MSYVYVVAHKAGDYFYGPIKVGRSQFPIGRLSSLQTGNPQTVGLAAVFLLPSKPLAEMCESECHAVLNQYTMRGEWFECEASWAVQVLSSVVHWALEEEYEDANEFAVHLKASGYASVREQWKIT